MWRYRHLVYLDAEGFERIDYRVDHRRRRTDRAAFAEAHNERYGYAREQLPVEAVNYRTRIVQRRDGTLPPLFTPTPDADAEAVLMEGAVTLGGQSVSALFADRATLPAGFTQDGPLVVEEPTATTLTPPGWRLTVLASGDLMLERIEP